MRRAYRLSLARVGDRPARRGDRAVPLVYLLPIDIGYGVSEGMLVLAFVLLTGWTVARMRRVARAEPAPG